MDTALVHLAINADDVDRAKAFYEAAFGWAFNTWGPPDFYQIKGMGVLGALQKRPDADAYTGSAFEPTFAVSDIEAAASKVKTAGGTVVEDSPAIIPGVGKLLHFRDTEDNLAIIMEFEDQVLSTPA